eukprot:Em0022g562a
MKAIIQRVASASVTVEGRHVSSIGRGLCVLLGISRDDEQKEADWMARKITSLRLFPDPASNKAWDKSVSDLGLEILCVSQFTLCHVLKGNKPDFHIAMEGTSANVMYNDFLKSLGSLLQRPEDAKGGEFGAYMQVHIQNDGPVTIQLETPTIAPPKQRKGSGASVAKTSTTEEDDAKPKD